MNLRELIKRKERTVWFEFVPGFDVRVRYVSLPERRKILENGEPRNVLRDGKLQQEGLTEGLENLTAAMIVEWKLSAAVAVQLLEVEADDLGGAEIPCTRDNKLLLIQEVSNFAVRVTNVASALENFRAEELKAETENLPQS